MSRETSVQEWLNKAESDRDTAKYLLAGEKYADCAFYCQQAVEKLLKAAWVAQTGQRPPRIHDLRALLDKASPDADNENIENAVNSINGYYSGSRYPLDSVDPSIFQKPLAESAIQKTDQVFEWFLARINFDKE